MPAPNPAKPAAAKAGLHAMTRHLAMEPADYKIRVNAVAPALLVTPSYGEFIDPHKIEETLAGFRDFHAIGRSGCTDRVAAAIDFFRNCLRKARCLLPLLRH